ncbi:UDP-forming cellulose synthase catalytic subunit [Photobacterium sp. SDRW27]|uniref:UDP-forming cellulose synthase catalytic subunit n=1 Tax=Photobacterium obscurum TaxID=2829490 RepID=UPI002243DE92|nr:UDP-forming cellulose synthase catalytic subunit [Photobacterium obscurum]MCW8329960.1 UDP-forming cellulose synthase catalytic subunit [Photobacterium obscurum]
MGFIFKPVIIERFNNQLTAYSGGKPVSFWGKLVLFVWFGICSLFLRPTIHGVSTWTLPLRLFPHVNFLKPTIVDSIRCLIQTLWLLMIRQEVAEHVNLRNSMRTGVLRKVFARFVSLPMLLVRQIVSWIERKAENNQSSSNNEATRLSLSNVVLSSVIVFLSMLCFTVPFGWQAQAIFVMLLWSMAMMVRRIPGRLPNMLLIILSLTASCRYIWWRYTSTLNWDDSVDLTLGIILLLAESYSWLVLVLGYFQNIWPLQRKPVLLPKDVSSWPTIDLMIPTYNEDLDVIKTTVLSALGVDWPRHKLNIYILDDGKRDEFKAYAEEVGVHYIRRPTNEYAKAGNLNYALKHTQGEFVAIFDCDHVPTRAFFQVTMGAFLKDPKLALIQTPHHFFSPDPFERNLANFRDVPNEGNLFYGLVQDGNDMWDATFFCGSCAILRRTALEAVGGIAVETVTEDAHTSLKMHRLGYKSAYLRQPVSAGLATETLSAHVGQRIRWARGMAQIFRLDNPLKGKGLKWHQRLCYLNAMLHFLSGIPRIIFLVAPLAFLLLHSYIIYAPAIAIVLYVIPHMVHASITNSRMQGKYRHSFWGEVYETVLAWYIARPTTVALFAPNKGKFNVTAKGGLIEEAHFDWHISKPYLILMGLNVLGVCFGIYRLGWGPADEIATTIVNLLWTFYNLLILGGAIAVAAEAKQIRKNHRIDVDIPIMIRLKTGHLYPATMRDFSLGGLRVEMADNSILNGHQEVEVILQRSSEKKVFHCRVAYRGERYLGLQLESQTTQQQIDYVQCTFARADNWLKWQQQYQTDRPMNSFKSVLLVGLKGYERLIENSPRIIKLIYQSVRVSIEFVFSLRPRFVQLKDF